MQNKSNSVFLCAQVVRIVGNDGCIVRCMRLSGSCDMIPCVLFEPLPPCVHLGHFVQLSGHLTTTAELPLAVQVQQIAPLKSCAWENLVTLQGVLAAPPHLRQTPKGREVCDVWISQAEGSALPAIIWGKAAHRMHFLPEGMPLFVQGRLQSRPGRQGKALCELSICRFTPLH